MSDPNVISAAPLVDFLRPYIEITVQSAIGVVVIYAAALVQKYTGVQISQTSLDKLRSAAATQAGVLVAGAEDNLAGKSITIDHPLVIQGANTILANLPDAAKAVGATPEALQRMIVGEIGKLQAATTVTPK